MPDAARSEVRGPPLPSLHRHGRPHARASSVGRPPGRLRGVAPRPQLALERLERRRVRVDDRLVAFLGGAEPLDAVQPRAQRLQEVLTVERIGVAEGLPGPAEAGPEQRLIYSRKASIMVN